MIVTEGLQERLARDGGLIAGVASLTGIAPGRAIYEEGPVP